MPTRRFLPTTPTALFAWSLLLGVGACERSKLAVRVDSASGPVGHTESAVTGPTAISGWNSSAGLALFVQGETRNEAIVLLPTEEDTAAFARLATLGNAAAEITLFGRGGALLTAQLGPAPLPGDAECRIWPLQNIHGDGADNTWAIGFVGAQTAALPLDSVDVLSSRDSLALAAEASRLASAVTATTAPSFQGLRFTAHDIRRFEISPGIAALVAHLTRKVNQEANPQEEQTLLIAERDSGVTTGAYTLAYAERTHGLEETTTAPEVIGGVRIAGRPTLVIARDGDQGVAYAVLERTGLRRWRIRWTSGLTRCG